MNDNALIPNNNTDILYKLTPMINQLNSNFVKLYNVPHNLSVDENMILFKDWNSLKQYNPMKPIKRSFNLWSLADMDGYLYHCEVYQEKKSSVVRSLYMRSTIRFSLPAILTWYPRWSVYCSIKCTVVVRHVVIGNTYQKT